MGEIAAEDLPVPEILPAASSAKAFGGSASSAKTAASSKNLIATSRQTGWPKYTRRDVN